MFERYASIIPDFDGFQDALRRPRDLYFRVNSLRIDPGEFERSMKRWGHNIRPLRWFKKAYLATELARTRGTLEYFLGFYYIQGATSMIAPIALDPQPGERVLDLCAAPGSKTTQICDAMRNEGLVFANDIYIDRLKILKGHLERLGVTCAVITKKAGDSFPGGLAFRRVLVDAPCSGEGTMRGARETAGEEVERESEAARGTDRSGDLLRLYRLQRALLRRAANLCEPGGVIVYSTCTYSPLENEAVIDEVLRARDDLVLEEVPCDAPSEPGILEWEGKKFKPEVRLCRRYYPHRINSWGFFVARLRRKESARGPRGEEESRWAEPSLRAAVAAQNEARERVARYFEERFGIPRASFEPFHVYEGGHSAWLASRAMPRPEALAPWDPQNAGIRLLRYLKGPAGPYEKPTSHGLAVVGRGATRAAIDLSEKEMWAFLRGEPVRRRAAGVEGGYVIARYEGWVLGCGLQTAEGVVSQIPVASGENARSSLFLAPAGPGGAPPARRAKGAK
jgi:NOL1/NOP2/sun family putative RNA methylase